jgi:type I restriction enzyme M protein
MTAIERDNPSLKGVLPKDYARPGLDKQRLGQLINLVSDIGLGSPADRAKDILGRVYEYFLASSPAPKARRAGSSTRRHVVRVLVEMLAPYKGRVYDPCCGSGGMFVQARSSSRPTAAAWATSPSTARSRTTHLAVGQDEPRHPRHRRAISAHGDTFHNDQHPDLKADYVLANPPFNSATGAANC